LIVPTKKGLNGGQNVNKDEANCPLGYVDIALICNEELDSALIRMEDEKDKAKFQTLWVGDSGATCHMVCNDQNLTNWKFVNEEVIVAGGRT
jgi:hypothetical protein